MTTTVTTSPTGCVAGARMLISLAYTGYQVFAGQRGGRLSMSSTPIDTSNKDSDFWNESLPGFRGWNMSADGCVVEDDLGHIAIWHYFVNNDLATAKLTTPNGTGFWGRGFITALDYEGAHDGAFMYSTTIQGSGKLYKG